MPKSTSARRKPTLDVLVARAIRAAYADHGGFDVFRLAVGGSYRQARRRWLGRTEMGVGTIMRLLEESGTPNAISLLNPVLKAYNAGEVLR